MKNIFKSHTSKHTSTPDAPSIICGGSSDTSDPHAPKSIQSSEITNFACNFVPNDISENITPIHGRYIFHAKIEGDQILGSYKVTEFNSNFRGLTYDFTTDLTFMNKLQQLVKSNNLAQYNGLHHTTYGIPEEFGADLHIDYSSGEYISADDNSSCFFDNNSIKDIYELFYETSGAKAFEETDELHSIYYKIYGKNGRHLFLADIVMTPDQTVHLYMRDFEDKDTQSEIRKEVSPELLTHISEINNQFGLSHAPAYPHRENAGISINLGLQYGKTYEIVQSNYALNDEQYHALLHIKEIIMKSFYQV